MEAWQKQQNVSSITLCSVLPSNVALERHFAGILKGGYDAGREPIDIFYINPTSMLGVEDFGLGYVDGQTKIFICFLIVSMVEEEGLKKEDIESSPFLMHTLRTFRTIRVNYLHYDRQDKHIMDALSAHAQFKVKNI
jgi:hypothetical protein